VGLSFPREHSRVTKRKTNTFLPPDFQLFLADLQHFRFSPGFPESCTTPKLSRIKRPKPNHIPEARASLRRQTYTRCRSHMPGSLGHIQSQKRVGPRRLSNQQRRDRESMTSSTIFNSLLTRGWVFLRYCCTCLGNHSAAPGIHSRSRENLLHPAPLIGTTSPSASLPPPPPYHNQHPFRKRTSPPFSRSFPPLRTKARVPIP